MFINVLNHQEKDKKKKNTPKIQFSFTKKERKSLLKVREGSRQRETKTHSESLNNHNQYMCLIKTNRFFMQQ